MVMVFVECLIGLMFLCDFVTVLVANPFVVVDTFQFARATTFTPQPIAHTSLDKTKQSKSLKRDENKETNDKD